MILQLFYLNNRISYTSKTISLYWNSPQTKKSTFHVAQSGWLFLIDKVDLIGLNENLSHENQW